MFSSRDHFAMGSGGHFALYLDADLLHGSSGPSDTHLGMRAYAGHRSRNSSSSRRMATAAMEEEVEVMKRWISLTPLQMQQQQRRLQRLVVHPHHRNKGAAARG